MWCVNCLPCALTCPEAALAPLAPLRSDLGVGHAPARPRDGLEHVSLAVFLSVSRGDTIKKLILSRGEFVTTL